MQADRDGANVTQTRAGAPVTFGMQGQFVIPDFAGQHRARGYPVRGAVQDAEMFAEPAHRPPAAGEEDLFNVDPNASQKTLEQYQNLNRVNNSNSRERKLQGQAERR